MAEAFAIVVLLMIPVVPVGLILLVVGWRGRSVRAGGVCPRCGGVIPGGGAAGPAGYCQKCGATLAGVAGVGQVERRRNLGMMISGAVLATILPVIAIVLLGVAVVTAIVSGVPAGGAQPVVEAAPAKSSDQPGAASGGQGAQVEAAAPVSEALPVGTTATEVMVTFTKAMMDGDERTMLACFVMSEAAHRPAILTGVDLKAAMVRLANETTSRFGTQQQKQEWEQRRAEIVSRWTNGQFVAEGDTGTLTPGAGKKNDLMPRHFVKTAEGWRLDSESAIRQNILGMTGGVALDQDKTQRLNGIVEQVRAGKYASREEANAAWVQAQNEAGQKDMERIIKAINASTQPAGR